MPGAIATVFGLMFAYGRQVFAMARSGHFPTALALTLSKRGTPYVCINCWCYYGLDCMFIM